MAACVYIACREARIPRTFDEVAGIANITRKEVSNAYIAIVLGLDLRIPLIDPVRCLVKLANKAQVDEKIKRYAIGYLKQIIDSNLSAGIIKSLAVKIVLTVVITIIVIECNRLRLFLGFPLRSLFNYCMSGSVVLYKWKNLFIHYFIMLFNDERHHLPDSTCRGNLYSYNNSWSWHTTNFFSHWRRSYIHSNLHLEGCIRQLLLGNAEEALDHCKSADQELDTLLANVTSES